MGVLRESREAWEKCSIFFHYFASVAKAACTGLIGSFETLLEFDGSSEVGQDVDVHHVGEREILSR